MQINEQKRRMENIGKIGLWQMSIDSWKVCDTLSKDVGGNWFVEYVMEFEKWDH